MKKYILTILLIYSSSYSQTRFMYSINPGLSIDNSENDMDLTKEKKFRWLPGMSLAYERENVLGYCLHLEYNLTYWKLDNVIEFARTGPAGPEIIDYYGADLILAINNIDVAIRKDVNDWASYTLGPTFSLVYRSFVMEDPFASAQEGTSLGIDDRLASLCLGINASLNAEVPFSNAEEYWFFFTSLKARFIHSIWFDDRGRKLDNYYQSFFYSQIHIGLGFRY